MTLGDDPIELMQGCLFTASYDGQLRGLSEIRFIHQQLCRSFWQEFFPLVKSFENWAKLDFE